MSAKLLMQSAIAGSSCRAGKVRDVYDLGRELIIVATDRISAFDWVLPTGIPDKGRVLTALTLFWLERLPTANHFLDTQIDDWPPPFAARKADLAGRSMRVRKTRVVPIECVVRGYLAGSAWNEYRQSGCVCGSPLPQGLVESQQLPEPIFTPATKEESGHDVNISWPELQSRVPWRKNCAAQSALLAQRRAAYASRGILIADTKFEWGQTADDELILIDEVLTPDSSQDSGRPRIGGRAKRPSFDKQFSGDWLLASGWDRNSRRRTCLPTWSSTRQKYLEAYSRLVGRELAWRSDCVRFWARPGWTKQKWLNLFRRRFLHNGREGTRISPRVEPSPTSDDACDAVVIVPIVMEEGAPIGW